MTGKFNRGGGMGASFESNGRCEKRVNPSCGTHLRDVVNLLAQFKKEADNSDKTFRQKQSNLIGLACVSQRPEETFLHTNSLPCESSIFADSFESKNILSFPRLRNPLSKFVRKITGNL